MPVTPSVTPGPAVMAATPIPPGWQRAQAGRNGGHHRQVPSVARVADRQQDDPEHSDEEHRSVGADLPGDLAHFRSPVDAGQPGLGRT